MVGGVCDRGACVGCVHGGACMAWGHALQGACMSTGIHEQHLGACPMAAQYDHNSCLLNVTCNYH